MAGIIVQDDNTFSTTFITEILRREGYTVRTASRITKELSAESPDLIIMYDDGEILPDIRQLAIMKRRFTFKESELRRAGVCCILNTDVTEIVCIIRDYLLILPNPPAE
ncbi:MAG: hypothetical protein IKI58_04180 [Oscillospiraceae bacterium]|nr:hypothetical protein [Oscillospiraceae bacterium]